MKVLANTIIKRIDQYKIQNPIEWKSIFDEFPGFRINITKNFIVAATDSISLFEIDGRGIGYLSIFEWSYSLRYCYLMDNRKFSDDDMYVDTNRKYFFDYTHKCSGHPSYTVKDLQIMDNVIPKLIGFELPVYEDKVTIKI